VALRGGTGDHEAKGRRAFLTRFSSSERHFSINAQIQT
jgi:hypothetical protein